MSDEDMRSEINLNFGITEKIINVNNLIEDGSRN